MNELNRPIINTEELNLIVPTIAQNLFYWNSINPQIINSFIGLNYNQIKYLLWGKIENVPVYLANFFNFSFQTPIEFEIPDYASGINLSNTESTYLDLSELLELQYCDISHNFLEEYILPESIKYLNLYANFLRDLILEEFTDLINLRIGGFPINKLTLPSSLRTLELIDAKISLFDFDLPNLEALDLHNNNLTTLKITGFPKLEYLNLEYNNLVSIPENIEKLNNIHTLLLIGNPIFYVSPKIKKLKNLTRFNISEHSLFNLPVTADDFPLLDGSSRHFFPDKPAPIKEIPPFRQHHLNLEQTIEKEKCIVCWEPKYLYQCKQCVEGRFCHQCSRQIKQCPQCRAELEVTYS